MSAYAPPVPHSGPLPTDRAGMSTEPGEGLRTLAQLLWSCREHLERIEFLLEVDLLLMENRRERWLARISDELRATTEDLVALDLRRTAATAEAAAHLGLDQPASLRDLADRAPQPWGDIFTDHARWFAQALVRIGAANQLTRSTAEQGLARVSELLNTIGGTRSTGYDHAGRAVAGTAGGSVFFDDRT
jgi:hypothetical protein